MFAYSFKYLPPEQETANKRDHSALLMKLKGKNYLRLGFHAFVLRLMMSNSFIKMNYKSPPSVPVCSCTKRLQIKLLIWQKIKSLSFNRAFAIEERRRKQSIRSQIDQFLWKLGGKTLLSFFFLLFLLRFPTE